MCTDLKTTPELKIGDIVNTYGMRIRLDTHRVYRRVDDDATPVHAFTGTVLNMAEVRETARVPLSWLRQGDRDDVWTVQGNRFAAWYTER